MKKLIAIVAFFAISLASTNSAIAQNLDTKALSTNAKAFAQQLSQDINLSDVQVKSIYNAHMLKERQLFALRVEASRENNTTLIAAKRKAIIDTFTTRLEDVLNPTQFKKYLTLTETKI